MESDVVVVVVAVGAEVVDGASKLVFRNSTKVRVMEDMNGSAACGWGRKWRS